MLVMLLMKCGSDMLQNYFFKLQLLNIAQYDCVRQKMSEPIALCRELSTHHFDG